MITAEDREINKGEVVKTNKKGENTKPFVVFRVCGFVKVKEIHHFPNLIAIEYHASAGPENTRYYAQWYLFSLSFSFYLYRFLVYYLPYSFFYFSKKEKKKKEGENILFFKRFCLIERKKKKKKQYNKL